MHWQRQRKPDEVPTPTAVALSDFCRRASSPSSAGEVREALATVLEQEDFRVRELTDGEPTARPLGPFAAVDILRGTEPALAAQRQQCGYYDLVKELLTAREASLRETPLPPAADPSSFASAEPPGLFATAEERTATRSRAPKPSVSERIAPRKRVTPEPALEATAPAASEAVSFSGTGRELPKPRGRYSRLEMPKASFEELFAPAGKEQLTRLLVQHVHRPALLVALEAHYVGRAGTELGLMDLDASLSHHGLLESVVAKERELVLGAFEEHRGATGRVAWALDTRPSDLAKWIARLGLTDLVEASRERFRREALATPVWTAKLDLLGRTKYLGDLGIQDRFAASLRKELGARLLAAAGPVGETPPELYGRVAKKLGVAPEMLSRAVEKLGLHLGPEKVPHGSPEQPNP